MSSCFQDVSCHQPVVKAFFKSYTSKTKFLNKFDIVNNHINQVSTTRDSQLGTGQATKTDDFSENFQGGGGGGGKGSFVFFSKNSFVP